MSIFLKTEAQRGKPCSNSHSREEVEPSSTCSNAPLLRHRPALGPKLLILKGTHLLDSWSALSSLTLHRAWAHPSALCHLRQSSRAPEVGGRPVFKMRALRPQVLSRQLWSRGSPYLTQQACQALWLHYIQNGVLQTVGLQGGKVAIQVTDIQDGLEGLLVSPLCPAAVWLVAVLGVEG